MKNHYNSYILFSLLFLQIIFGISLNAKVAKPGLITAQQPDGSLINIRLEGNEQNKAAYSEDGFLLTYDSEGFYVIATTDENGNLVSSGIRQINPETRNSGTIKFLQSIDRTGVTEALKSHRTKNKLNTRGPGLFSDPCVPMGKQKGLAILVQFDDLEFTIEDPKDHFYRMLNEENFSDGGATGSARDYYIENSGGLFYPEFDVYGPVTLDKSYTYYGENNTWGEELNSPRMISEACALINDEVDFSEYDLNGDGYVEMVYVFYAGYGEADGGPSNSVWPHSWSLTEGIGWPLMKDDVYIDTYACSNELQFGSNKPDGIGSFVHEYGHVIGLPDLYNTSYSSGPFTPGFYDAMDAGSYNNNSHTPPNFSSFERYALDWLEPIVIDSETEIELLPLGENNRAYILPTENENEFFLFENRQRTGNDAFIPGEGMLVWHIDFVQEVWDYNEVNNDAKHQHVDIIEADGKRNYRTSDGDTFPGAAGITELTPFSEPTYMTWSDTCPAFSIREISEDGDIIRFKTVATENLPEAGVTSLTEEMKILNIEGHNLSCKTGIAEIYDISGRKLTLVGQNIVTLNPGLYIARVNGTTLKFMIK